MARSLNATTRRVSNPLNEALFAHYNCNDASGSTLADSVDSFNGTLINTPTWVAGGIQFDGITQYVSVLNTYKQFGKHAISVSMVFSWDGGGDASGAPLYYAGGGYRFLLDKASGNFYFQVWNGSTWIGNAFSTQIQSGVTYHVISTYNPTTQVISNYLNRVADGTTSSVGASVFSGHSALYFGGNATASSFSGVIYDLKFFNRVLTSTEISDNFNSDGTLKAMGKSAASTRSLNTKRITSNEADALVNYFGFDEGSGTSLIDKVKHNNPGTISGAVYTAGKLGTALDFDGVDDYVEIPHIASQQLKNGFSVSFWADIDGIGETNGRILDKSTDATGGGGFLIGCTSFARLYIQINGGTTRGGASSAMTWGMGTWYFLTVTVAADATCTWYLNGAADGTPGASGALSGMTTEAAMRIGNRSGATDRSFNGRLDEMKIWNRALTADEVLRLYQNYSL